MNLNFWLKHGLFALFLLSLAQSGGSQTALKYIPADADVVVTFNLQNIDKKVNLAQLKQYDFFQASIKEMYKTPELENDTAFQLYFEKMITDPASLGFDTKEPLYIFVEKVGFDSYTTTLQKLGDRSRYEAAILALKGDKLAPNLTEANGMKLWQSGTELFAWNDEVVMNVLHEKGYDPSAWEGDYGDEEYDYSDMEEVDTTYEEEYVYEEEEEELMTPPPGLNDSTGLEAPPIGIEEDNTSFDVEEDFFNSLEEPDTAAMNWAMKVMNRDFPQPITRNGRFALAKGKTDDVHFWVDYAMILESTKTAQQSSLGMAATNDYAQAMMASMGGMMEILFGEAYFSMGLNFENGRMAMRNQVFYNEDMRQFYRRALDTKFNKKFLRYVKGGDEMFGYFYINYNIKNTIEETKSLLYKMFAKTPQYGEAAADAMKIIGIFIDEEAVGNLLKGDLMVSVSGLQTTEVKTKTYEYDADYNFIEKDTVMMKTMPVFTVLASYGNGKDIQKFIDLGLHSNVLVQEGSHYRLADLPGMDGQQFFLAKHDGMLIFTNNQYLMQQNLEKGFAKKLRLPKNHKKMLCKKAAVMYWNIPNTIKAAAGSQAESNIGITGWMNNLGKEFYSMEMTANKKVGDAYESEMFLNMTQKDTNALQQFFNFVNDVYLEVIGGAKI